MARSPQWPKDVADDLVGGVGKRTHEPAIALRVGAETLGGRLDGALQDRGRAVVEGVGERGGRVDQLQTVLGERELPEER